MGLVNGNGLGGALYAALLYGMQAMMFVTHISKLCPSFSSTPQGGSKDDAAPVVPCGTFLADLMGKVVGLSMCGHRGEAAATIIAGQLEREVGNHKYSQVVLAFDNKDLKAGAVTPICRET